MQKLLSALGAVPIGYSNVITERNYPVTNYPIINLLPVNLPEDNINASNGRDNVGNEPSFAHLRQSLKVGI
jgi:hypothetical protein